MYGCRKLYPFPHFHVKSPTGRSPPQDFGRLPEARKEKKFENGQRKIPTGLSCVNQSPGMCCGVVRLCASTAAPSSAHGSASVGIELAKDGRPSELPSVVKVAAVRGTPKCPLTSPARSPVCSRSQFCWLVVLLGSSLLVRPVQSNARLPGNAGFMNRKCQSCFVFVHLVTTT